MVYVVIALGVALLIIGCIGDYSAIHGPTGYRDPCPPIDGLIAPGFTHPVPGRVDSMGLPDTGERGGPG